MLFYRTIEMKGSSVKNLLWLTVLLPLLLFSPVIHAQSTDPNALWPIVEQCIPLETPAPAWTFRGTLLMTSTGQLTAYQQGWETPQILVSYSLDIPGTGILSPDGRWFATISGVRGGTFPIAVWNTEAITVHSTGTDDMYSLKWETEFFASQRLYGHLLYWLDDEHLLYSTSNGYPEETWFVINPFTQAVTEWVGPFNPTQYIFSLSPDGQKALYYDWGDLFSILYNGEEEIEVPVYGVVTWHPDSSQFAAFTISDNARTMDVLALFDITGDVISTVYDVPPDEQVMWNMGKTWSPDGRYLLFGTEMLYLADIDEQIVINTCIPTHSATIAWNPTSTQEAMIEQQHTDPEIQILDLTNWERYSVDNYDGAVIGWRVTED